MVNEVESLRSPWPKDFLRIYLPPLIIPILLMIGKFYFIDLPAKKPEYEVNIERKVIDAPDDSTRFRCGITILNVGTAEGQENRTFLMVNFLGKIDEVENPLFFPIGTYFLSGKNNRTVSCEGLSVCKVVIGHLAPGGQISLAFISPTPLQNTPYVGSSGVVFKPTRCVRLRRELAGSCLKVDEAHRVRSNRTR